MNNLHVIIGEDDYLVAETARKFVGDGTGLEVIDSNPASNADLQLRDLRAAEASFSTPPFLEPRKVTWWKNVHFLPQGGGKKAPAEEVKEALEAFAKKLAAMPLPENQVFILSGPRLLQSSVFAKTLKGAAEMVVFASGKGRDAAQQAALRAAEFAREAGFRFAPGAAETFAGRVGSDTRSLLSEIGKLRSFLGENRKEATKDDVETISSPGVGVEPVIWSVTDAVSARQGDAAVAALRNFEGENGFAVMATTVLEKHFRQLVELKDATERGKFAEAAKDMNAWAAGKAKAALPKWTLRELRIARARFMRLREMAVSGGPAEILVVTELVRVLRGL